MHTFISISSISSSNHMIDHLLELTHRDDSNKWSNIEFGEEITQGGSIKAHYMHLIKSSVFKQNNRKSLLWTWLWLDLILILFSTAAVCPSSWGRQQAANTSNTWSPGSSVLWIDATNAASIHVSLHTIWPCVSWSPSSFWTWALHIGDRLDTGWRSDDVFIPCKTLRV